jgi:hypothetical protein
MYSFLKYLNKTENLNVCLVNHIIRFYCCFLNTDKKDLDQSNKLDFKEVKNM